MQNLNTNWIIVLTLIVVTWVNFNITRWQRGNIIEYDVAGYYSYLPAVFYEHDLSLSFVDDSVNQYFDKLHYWPNIAPNGNKVLKGSMGMAVTYLPFFGMAHIYCLLRHEKTDGFSPPYHFAIQFSSLFYFLIGLLFLFRILKLFYTDNLVILITVACVTFGTNIIYYLTNGAGMAHATDFAFISAFIFFTIRWHNNQSIKNAIIIGVLGGLITLIRPINILIFLFFFFYNVGSLKDLTQKFKLFLKHYLQIIIISICGVLVYLPQLIYWKWISGSLFFNSYVGERFFFNNPHIMDGLFSFRKGWLVYTPIMLFSLIGFYYLRKNRSVFTAALIFTGLYIYVAFSWWCWWYGGSFGQRSLIDIYPLLALPFAAFLTYVQSMKKIARNSIYTILFLLILLNIFQTMQAKWNTIHFDSMTKDAYVDAFLRLTKNPEREKFLKHPDYQKALQGIDEY